MENEKLMRAAFVALLICAFSISGFYRSRARKHGGGIDRRSEPLYLIGIRLLLVVPIIVFVALFVVGYPPTRVYPIGLSPALRWTGFALAFAMIPLLAWVLRTIGVNISETVLTRDGQQLVTGGPYRRIRHPLYSFGILFILGLSLLADSWPLLIMAMLGFPAFYFISGREEQHLVQRFGDAYRQYRLSSGRLFPRLVVNGRSDV